MSYLNQEAWGSVGATFLVDELVTSERGYASGPERALMSALLFDGVQNFLCYFETPESRSIERYKEAYQWVMSRGGEYVFAFDSVCEALGMDPNYLRLGLINASNSQLHSRKRARRTF